MTDKKRDQDDTVEEETSDETAEPQTAAQNNAAAGFAGPTPEMEDLRQQLMRVAADFENYKRRSADEQARNAAISRLSVVLEFLPVIDNFERAFKDVPKEIESSPWYGGVSAIKQQFESTLKSLGIARIETVGQPFDPNLHEAISHEASDKYDADIVSEEFEAGYRLGDDVIRHAKVKVSNGKKK